MQFNEFNRRLEHCHVDPETKYLLTHMFEVQIEFSKQLDEALSIMHRLAETLQNVTDLHGVTLEEVKRMRQTPGVEVRSVKREEDF